MPVTGGGMEAAEADPVVFAPLKFAISIRPMLKHFDLTRQRLQVFLETVLRPAIRVAEHPLKIEFNPEPAANDAEAARGPWTEVGAGFRYGPAYRTVWFRLSGTVPAEFAGRPVVVVAEVGGERTAWRDGSPWCGIDHQHSDFGWLEGSAFSGLGPTPAPGQSVEYLIQAYARNAESTVSGREQPRSATTETVSHAALAVIDPGIRDLAYDVDFTLNLLDTISRDDPAAATLLRALNDVVTQYDQARRELAPREATPPEVLAKCRKGIRDALGSLNGEFKHTITPVGHAHLDTAWLWPIAITKQKMAHTTATQLGLIERYPEYVFAHSQASQYEWLETDHPALFDRVKAAVRRGQWEPVGSMWVEADCNLAGGESLVRQFLYGRRYFREKLGYVPEDMWLPDVFGYSAALPQILRKCNIKCFLTQKISWNQFNRFPHNTFYWQGIDGSRIWSHFPPADTYNGSAEPKEVVYSVKNYKDHARSDQSLYLFGFGDGGGGPTERHLEFLRRGRLAPQYPEIATGKRAVDFFREARGHSRDLQTWVGELYLELHRGTYTSQAANKMANRRAEFLLRDSEWLAAFAPGFPDSYPAAELEATWKRVLVNQFHDIIPGSSVREVYEDSARDYAAVEAVGERVIAEALARVAQGLDTTDRQRPVALFQNATGITQGELPWPLTALPMDSASPDAGVAEPPVSIIAGDEVNPVQLVTDEDGSRLIFAVPAAALGIVAVADLSSRPAASRPKLKTSNRRIEDRQFSVRFDASGNIAGILNLEDGFEVLEPNRLGNVFQLFDDRPNFWSAWDIDAFALETGTDLLKSDRFEITERGPVRVAAEITKSFGNSQIRQRISLGPTPGIRFDTIIDWHETDRMLKVAFPVNINATRATHEIQFGNVERPTHYNTSWDMAKFETCAHKWVDLSEGDRGVALLNDGKYGHDVHQNVMRLTLLRAPKAPDPQCDMGRHRFTYVLLPHYGSYRHGGVVEAAYALNAPLRYLPLPHQSGVAGTLPAFIASDDRNLVIETVKKAEDSSDLIVRLYECHNARGRAEIAFAVPPSASFLCDMEENELAELDVVDGVVSLDYRPFEILTLKLRR